MRHVLLTVALLSGCATPQTYVKPQPTLDQARAEYRSSFNELQGNCMIANVKYHEWIDETLPVSKQCWAHRGGRACQAVDRLSGVVVHAKLVEALVLCIETGALRKEQVFDRKVDQLQELLVKIVKRG